MHTHPGLKSGGERVIPLFGHKGETWPKKWLPPPSVHETQVETRPRTLTRSYPPPHVAIELLSSLGEVRKRIFHPQSATCTKQAKNGNIGQKLEVISKVPQSTKGLAYSQIKGTIVGLYKFGYDALSRTWIPRSKGSPNERVEINAKHGACSLWRPMRNREWRWKNKVTNPNSRRRSLLVTLPWYWV